MPLRLPCKRRHPPAGTPLFAYWGTRPFHRPTVDVHVLGPGASLAVIQAQIDTGADYTLLESGVAQSLGLRLPFPQRATASGAAGGAMLTPSFPPVGVVSLFVTDYTEYCYLPAPFLGFHDPAIPAAAQRSVLGLTGFLEHFRFVLDHGLAPPGFELHPLPGFPGQTGALPRGLPLADLLRRLRGP